MMMDRLRRAWFDDAEAQKECWFVIADPEEAWLDDGQAPHRAWFDDTQAQKECQLLIAGPEGAWLIDAKDQRAMA